MELFYKILWVVHFVNVALLIVIVLIQTGKGSEVGFALGSGTAQTMFGSSGGKNVIMKATIVVAVIFMTTSVILAYMQARVIGDYRGVMNTPVPKQEQAIPGQVPAEQPRPAVPVE
ncbi:MAG TPA: preprotein translocase subunit SecG, partial [bacterium]|nr:preprotein translocase subunit SecG [bacterium]